MSKSTGSTPKSKVSQDFQSNPIKVIIRGLDKLFNYNLAWGVVLLVFGLASLPQFFSDMSSNSAETTSPAAEFSNIFSQANLVPLLLLGLGIIAVVLAVSTFLEGVLSYVAFKTSRQEKASFSETFSVVYAKFPTLFIAQMLSLLKIIGGTLLLIIPGIRAALRYQFVFFPIFEENVSATTALKRTRELTENHLLEIFSIHIYSSFIPILSPALLVSGQAEFYHQLKALKESKAAPPRTHWLNYLPLIFLAGLILLIVTAMANLQDSDFNQPTNIDTSQYST